MKYQMLIRPNPDQYHIFRGRIREVGLAEACSLLAPVYQSFTEGFGFPDLVKAHGLLEEFGRPVLGNAPRA
jgi:hypothetical protein